MRVMGKGVGAQQRRERRLVFWRTLGALVALAALLSAVRWLAFSGANVSPEFLRARSAALHTFRGLRYVSDVEEIRAIAYLAEQFSPSGRHVLASASQEHQRDPSCARAQFARIDAPYMDRGQRQANPVPGGADDDAFLLHNEYAAAFQHMALQLMYAAAPLSSGLPQKTSTGSRRLPLFGSVPTGLGYPSCFAASGDDALEQDERRPANRSAPSPMLCLLRPASECEPSDPAQVFDSTLALSADSDRLSIFNALLEQDEIIPPAFRHKGLGWWFGMLQNYLLRPSDLVVGEYINEVIAHQDLPWYDREYMAVFVEAEQPDAVEALASALQIALVVGSMHEIADVFVSYPVLHLPVVIDGLRQQYPGLNIYYAHDADPHRLDKGDALSFMFVRDLWLLAAASALISSSCRSELARAAAAIAIARGVLVSPPLVLGGHEKIADCSRLETGLNVPMLEGFVASEDFIGAGGQHV
ncbi:hypothetical protein FVE85_8147 [Porphyridium purpureum]|uniref:Uncharacterized protein n=1 Tax=Porphyridium purpureum TaxID=35688 RepID=A0A5J4YNX0_PORPP|nr:hypothetical protein FVE85_8147 [Porphyridium purpureum]|eukprot:POR3263..scf295_9